MNVALSIIVPVYRAEQYLVKCIESILNQTFDDFELILIDDGSPDKSGEICDIYARKDSRIKVIHKQNGGASSARNAGLEIAKGEYIGFVDSDDWIHKEMYYTMYQLAKERRADIVQCRFKEIFKEEEDEEIQDAVVHEYTPLEAMQKIYGELGITTIIVCNKIYNRKLFEKNRFEEGRICEDEIIIHELLKDTNKVVDIEQELYYYMQTSNSVMRSMFSIKKMDYLLALERRLVFFKEIGDKDLIENTWLSYGNTLIYIYYEMWKNKLKNPRIKILIKQKYKICYMDIKDNKKANIREKIKFRLFRYVPQICCRVVNLKSQALG